jgi:hypothetical protein
VTTREQLSSDEAKQVVLNLGTAINDESFPTARIYVADDIKYEGPFGHASKQKQRRFRGSSEIQE